MTVKIVDFEKDSFLILSSGEYSDYIVNGLFKVLKKFNAEDKLNEWAKETGRKYSRDDEGIIDDYGNNEIGFTGWLNANGYIEDIEHRELHLGDYGIVTLYEMK